MIAKVVTHGPDRETAIARSVMALDSFVIRGVSNNISFLCSVLDRARFRKGFLTTDFINEEYPDGFNPIEMTNSVREVLIGVAALAHVCETARMTKISGRTDGGRYRPSSDWVVSIGNEECAIAINPTDGGCHIFLEGAPLQVQGNWMLGSHLFTGEVNGRTVNVQIDRLVEGYCLTHRGTTTQVVIRDTRAAALTAQMPEKLPPDMSRYVLSPMPGRVVSISIQPGDFVKAGEELLVIDAMKMENVLCAERDGTVADVRVAAGDSLSVDQVILELEPTATA
jgi:propionyl-CoA carboxylase alpha chain